MFFTPPQPVVPSMARTNLPVRGGNSRRLSPAPSFLFTHQRPDNIRAGCANANKAGGFSSFPPDCTRAAIDRQFSAESLAFPFVHFDNFAHRINSTSFQSRKQERNGEAIAWLQKGFARS
jgi:hypothetical protein